MTVLINFDKWQLIFWKRFSKPCIKLYCTFTAYSFGWLTLYIERGETKISDYIRLSFNQGYVGRYPRCLYWVSGQGAIRGKTWGFFWSRYWAGHRVWFKTGLGAE